jgi:hypothetical protein
VTGTAVTATSKANHSGPVSILKGSSKMKYEELEEAEFSHIKMKYNLQDKITLVDN